MDESVGRGTRCRRCWPRTPGKAMLAWGGVALIIGLAATATSQPSLPALLRSLELSDYPAEMWPPPFEAHTVKGQAVSLAELRGRVVLLNFWASWCAECRPEMPMFERLHREFAAQGLTVLGMNFDEEPQTIQPYARDLGLTFPLVLDPQGDIARAYGVIGLPTTLLIGRDGRPVALAVGPRVWDSTEARTLIRVLLAESVAQETMR
jgi:peroxiredoxin